MRVHREYAALGLWSYGEPARRIARPANVAVVRFELVRRAGVAVGWLDVLLETPEHRTVLSPILVDLSLLVLRDPAALIYPHAAEVLFDADGAATMTDFLLPAVRALTRARVVPLEDVWYVRPSAAFDRARAERQPGAGPLAASLPRIARWTAAIRLAGGGPVAIRSRDAALGAAVAAQLGSPVNAGGDAEPDGWFPPPATSVEPPRVCIADRIENAVPAAIRVVFEDPGHVAGVVRTIDAIEPLPLDIGISYDRADGPVAARSWIVSEPVPDVPARARTPLAHDPGRAFTFIVRPDFSTAPDSDTDEVNEFAARIRAAGSSVAIVPAPFTVPRDARDVLVIWGALGEPHVRGTVAQCVPLNRPFALIVTPESSYSRWYEVAIQSIVEAAPDDAELERLVRAFDARKLDLGDPPIVEPADERDLSAFRRAVNERCIVALSATDGPDDLRGRFDLPGLAVESYAPLVPADDFAVDGASLAGYGPYAFVHAAAAITSGLATVVLALRDTDVPLVVAAARAEPSCLTTLRRIAGKHTVIVTDATPSEIHALYRRATLFIDPALRSRGLSRVVRAARSGAIPVVFAEAAAARLLPPPCLVPRAAVSDLRDTVRRLWADRDGRVLPAYVRSSVGAVFGTEETVARSATQLLAAFASVGS